MLGCGCLFLFVLGCDLAMRMLLFYLGCANRKKAVLCDWCCLLWDARLWRRLDTRNSKRPWLWDCYCLVWDARLSRKLFVCFGSRDTAKDVAMRLLWYVLGRATQQKTKQCKCCTWQCGCCSFFLGRATQKKSLLWDCCFVYSWDARLR